MTENKLLPRVIPLCERVAYPGEIIPLSAYYLTFVRPDRIDRDTILWAIEKIEKRRGVEFTNERLKQLLSK